LLLNNPQSMLLKASINIYGGKMTITNKHNLPEGFVKAVSTEKHNVPGSLSATTLIQGVKQIILTDRYWDLLEDDVSDRIWAIFGSAVHHVLESEGENTFPEQEMSYQVADIKVTGKIDNYDMKHGLIDDYKTASVTKVMFGDFTDWYLQGMIYAWLLRKNGFNAERCRFIALLKDHNKMDAMRDSQYPKNPVHVHEYPVTPQGLFKIGIYIKNKVDEYKRCLLLSDDDIPPCAPEERWDRPPKYAVMKNGVKRAVRLFDTQEEADQLAGAKGEGYCVVFRKGESIRCQSYCLCRRFCNPAPKLQVPPWKRQISAILAYPWQRNDI